MVKYLRIFDTMCGCWKLCLSLFLLVVGVLYRAFVFLFVSSSAIILTRWELVAGHFQHDFHCSINETGSPFILILLIICQSDANFKTEWVIQN